MEIGRMICCGCNYVADEWKCEHHIGINRLYHIHEGDGGCRFNGTNYKFEAGYIYYIPYTDDFFPYSSSTQPLLHTYADFELIPPILTDKIIKSRVTDDETLASAVAVFDAVGKSMTESGTDLDFLKNDEPTRKLITGSILFLVSHTARENSIPIIRDEIVLRAITAMHTRISENITVTALAEELFMNKDSFIRRFSRIMGVTPYAYLKNLRLRTARSLIDSGMRLSEAAYQTGYSDSSALLHALAKNAKKASL